MVCKTNARTQSRDSEDDRGDCVSTGRNGPTRRAGERIRRRGEGGTGGEEGAVNGSLPGIRGTAQGREVQKQRENAMVTEGEVGWQLMKQRYRRARIWLTTEEDKERRAQERGGGRVAIGAHPQ